MNRLVALQAALQRHSDSTVTRRLLTGQSLQAGNGDGVAPLGAPSLCLSLIGLTDSTDWKIPYRSPSSQSHGLVIQP